ncbi:efflux RND transporter permease subunit [Sphingomonas sp.]|jgi:multidrug efflux pump subunit AcrB|uniref:efflux RND transporter permease subunit n=1 Tax=Sphingomonas sp. TaxID=28214 RepID=UPI002E3739BE|nr:efflux RND transporter permease subunit [Sphingomonas sp.]HEX4695639.1 efflux RND transporter permease subunit [Sphingomonas sp.]
MGFRNISAWSIRNPVPSLVLFFMLSIAGLFAFFTMQVNQDPDIDFPLVFVVVSQPGAAPTELENQVTQKIETAVRSLSGVDEIDSTVTEGNSQTAVQLQIGTNTDRAIEDIRSAIQQVRSSLPDGILEPQVIRIDTSGNDLASYAAISTAMTVKNLSWYIDDTVTKELLSVPGLSTVNRNGGVDREIRVKLDPARMQSLGLTAAQVNAQLRQVNLNAAGGRAEIAGSEQTVRVLGNAKDAYNLGQMQISIGSGRMVRLTDIATVVDDAAEARSASQLNGAQVITFDFQRAKSASDISVFHGAEKKLADLEKRNPNVKFKLIFNQTEYAEKQYHSALEAMGEGALLAVVVVFLFLRDWRATAISALAIPLSAIPTFWVMQLMGFTLNQMTLLALSLVAGVLVDDAIVEIENIVRHMRMGKTAYQAAIDAADEIGIAVLATTMSIVAVFFPVALMPGVAGQFFKNFGLTVVVSVLMSLAVARLITPMIAAYFLRAKGHAKHGEGRMMDWYMNTLRWTLRHRWSAIVGGACALVLTIFFFMILPQSFQPDQDQDDTTANIEMVPGTTLAETQTVADQVYNLLKAQPQVADVYTRTFVGNARVTAIFKKDKDITSVQFERRLAPQLAQITDARVSFRSQQGWGSSGRDITIVLGGADPAKLNDQAQKIVADLQKLKVVTAPRVQGDLQQPELIIRPRFDVAADLGVTTAALSSTIRLATLGDIDQNKAKFSLSDRQVPITVALEQSSRSRMSTIENLPVPTANGGSVPLSTVADIGFGASPNKIARVQLQRQVTIGADLGINPKTGKPLVSGEAWKQISQIPSLKNLPAGISQLTLGQQKWQGEMIKNFFIALASGIFLVFAVLVLLYRRILPPFVNMGSLLLAPLGGLIALWIAGQPISMPVYIGLLMLFGIVAKNSILLIDFALEEMGKGVPSMEAIEDSGHKRAQPIVMTTVAMVAGMVPTALSLSGDASWRAPMGTVVIGGLILSTVLTLLIVPASFSLAIGIEAWLGPKLTRRLLTYRPGDENRPVIDQPGPRTPIGYGGAQPAE